MALPTVEEIITAADTNECCTISEQQALTNLIRILGQLLNTLPDLLPLIDCEGVQDALNVRVCNFPTEAVWLRATSNGTPIVANTDVIAAPGAGFFLRIGYINYSSAEASGGVDILVGVETVTTDLVYQVNLAPRSTFAHDIKAGAYDLPENEALEVALATAGLGVYYTIEYQILPVVV